MLPDPYPYIWRGKSLHRERAGQRCAKGPESGGFTIVTFEDNVSFEAPIAMALRNPADGKRRLAAMPGTGLPGLHGPATRSGTGK
jgi:hypothetical protein